MDSKSPRNKILIYVIVTIIWLGIWQLLSGLVGYEVLLPSPQVTFTHLVGLMGTSHFYFSIGATILRVLGGFLLGALWGTLLAICCHPFPLVRILFSPMLAIIRSTPFASFIILALLWLRTDSVPVFTAAIMSLPIFYEGVWEGIESVEDGMLHMARLYNFHKRDMLLYVYIPAVRPYFLAATASSLGLSFKTGVAAEVISSPKYAIGGMLSASKVYLETADLFAITAALILVSVVMEQCLRRLVG